MTSATPTPSLADTVRLAREAAGMSREDLASRAGVSYKTVERLENGGTPRRAMLNAIVAVLDLDLDATGAAA